MIVLVHHKGHEYAIIILSDNPSKHKEKCIDQERKFDVNIFI